MAKTLTVAALIATAALCLTALVGVAQAEEDNKKPLVVEGKVYCDTCRVKFETKLSEALEKATVKLVCRDRGTQETKLEMESDTDEEGHYQFEVTDGEHEDEICEVHLVNSPREDCNEIVQGWNAARVSLTRDVLVDPVRHANALGFMKKEAVKDCASVLQSMGFLPV